MKIKFHKMRGQTTKAMKLWMKWWTEYQSDPEITIAQIAEKYINPKTGKPYTRANVYYALHRIEELTA